MTATIRRLDETDLPAYREIRLEALRDNPGAYGASYDTAAARGDDYFIEALTRLTLFGAFDGQRLAGIAAFMGSDGPKQKHRGDLIQMYVRPEARGTGTGMGLVQSVLDHARGKVVQLHLGVATDNVAAIRLYDKAGFHIYGTEPRALYVDGRYIDEHLMVRFLDEGARKED